MLSGFGLELVSNGDRIYGSNGDVVDPTIPRRLGTVANGGQAVAVPDRDRLLMVSGSTINEYDINGFWTVGSQLFPGTSATDAVLAGSTLAITTATALVLVPIDDGIGAGFTSLAPTAGVGFAELVAGGSVFECMVGGDDTERTGDRRVVGCSGGCGGGGVERDGDGDDGDVVSDVVAEGSDASVGVVVELGAGLDGAECGDGEGGRGWSGEHLQRRR